MARSYLLKPADILYGFLDKVCTDQRGKLELIRRRCFGRAAFRMAHLVLRAMVNHNVERSTWDMIPSCLSSTMNAVPNLRAYENSDLSIGYNTQFSSFEDAMGYPICHNVGPNSTVSSQLPSKPWAHDSLPDDFQRLVQIEHDSSKALFNDSVVV
jgi:hypothetical protein